MTTVKYVKICNGHLSAVMVNRRQVLVNRITEIHKTRPGHFEGLAYGDQFHIEGGQAAGGSARDWFVSWDNAWDGHIRATSMVDALNLIETA